MRDQRILIGKSEELLSWVAICLLFWWFYLSSVWWLRFVKNQIQWPLCSKQKISRNGKGIFHNSANDRERWGLLIFCCQSNIWYLIMPTQPILRPTNTHTHTNKKDTVCLMTSAHPTSSPHDLISNSHHDGRTSFLITQLPKNKREFIP